MIYSFAPAYQQIDRLSAQPTFQQDASSIQQAKNNDNHNIQIETVDASAELNCNQPFSQKIARNNGHATIYNIANTLSSSTSSTSSSSTTGYSSAKVSANRTVKTPASSSSFTNNTSTPGCESTVIFSHTNLNFLMPMSRNLNSLSITADTSMCTSTSLSFPSMAHTNQPVPVTSPTALIAINNSVPCTTSIIGQKRNKSNFVKSISELDFSDNSMAYFNGIEQSCISASSSDSNNAGSAHASSNASKISLPYSCKVTIPKSPKPQRTLVVLESVILGLKSNINEVKSKVADLTLAVTNGYTALAKVLTKKVNLVIRRGLVIRTQCKFEYMLTKIVTYRNMFTKFKLLQTETSLRHLEQRISTLSKLQNSYQIHINMKDGIQNMYDAFKKSPGNQYKNLTNIKNGWKECIQNLCAIEAQTEALLGTFSFQVEKLIGFARLCPGDTYELQIKYGSHAKFQTRTKIAKDGSQLWDQTRFSFKVSVHDSLSIKINEIKFLGKNLLVGERACDTKDLFATTHSQRLTFNANTSGTLKLSMLITWMPFENCEESFVYFNPTQYLTVNSKERRQSSYNMNKLTSGLSDICMTDILHSNGREDFVDSPSPKIHHRRNDNQIASRDIHIDVDNEASLNTNLVSTEQNNEHNENDDGESSSSSSVLTTCKALTKLQANNAKCQQISSNHFSKKLKECLQDSNDLPNQSTTYSTDSLSSFGSSAKSSTSSVSPSQAKISNDSNRFADLKPDNDFIITDKSPKKTSKSSKNYNAPHGKPENEVERVLCDLLDNLVSSVANRLQSELDITLLPEMNSPFSRRSKFANKIQNTTAERNLIVNKRISMIWLDQNIRNSLFLEIDDDVNQSAVNSLIDLKNELDMGSIGLYCEESMEEELVESNSLKELIEHILDARLKSSSTDLSKFHHDLQSPCMRQLLASVGTRLEQLRSQFKELNGLRELIQKLDMIFYRISLLNQQNRPGSRQSNKEPSVTAVVEDVLHCFDFLDLEDYNKSKNIATTTSTSKQPKLIEPSRANEVHNSLTENVNAYNKLLLLPLDLESAITQHLGSCSVILNCLLNISIDKNSEKSYKLCQIEAMLFEKLNRETQYLRRFLEFICFDSFKLIVWNKLKSWREPNCFGQKQNNESNSESSISE